MLDDVILYYTTVLGLSILPFLMSFLMLLMMMMMMMLNWCMLVVGLYLALFRGLHPRSLTGRVQQEIDGNLCCDRLYWWRFDHRRKFGGSFEQAFGGLDAHFEAVIKPMFFVSRLCDDVRLTPRIPKTFGCMRFSILRHFKTIHYTSLYV